MKYKTPEQPLSLKGLQQGDNEQWKIFVEFYRSRLIYYTPVPQGKERFREDIVSNIIADIYVARYAFSSLEHMVHHMFGALRYESRRVIFGRNGEDRYLLGDSLLSQMDEYLSHPLDKESNMQQRIRYERWKDAAVAHLRSAAYRLPAKWKELILAHLESGRDEMAGRQIALGLETFAERADVLSRIKQLLDAPSPGSIYKDREQEIRMVLRRLSKGQKKLLLRVIDRIPYDQLAGELGISYKAVRNLLSELVRKLSAVITVPDVFGNNADLVKYLGDEKFLQLMKEEVIGKTTVTAGWKLRSNQIIEIILLREQLKKSWEEIAATIGCSVGTARKAYLDSGGTNERVRGGKLTRDQVVEIRRIYKEGAHTESSLASMFNVRAGTIYAILTGRIWKDSVQNELAADVPRNNLKSIL